MECFSGIASCLGWSYIFWHHLLRGMAIHFKWHLLFGVAIHFLTSPPMLTRGFQVTVDQRIFYSTLVHLCLGLCAWYRFKELPAFAVTCNFLLPKLFAVKLYTCDHQNFIHSGFYVLMTLIYHISALFLLGIKSYPKLLRLPSGWIARLIHHFFGWCRYKTWSLPL